MIILQQRVIEEALAHSRSHNWGAMFPRSRVASALAMQFCAFALFGLALWQLRVPAGHGLFVPAEELGITVTPGDIELERGSSLVVAARFKGAPPARVDLVYGQAWCHQCQRSAGQEPCRPALWRNRAGSRRRHSFITWNTAENALATYKIKVFDYPRLERADADIRYPEYTGLPPRRIENTRRISGVEGSRIRSAAAIQ